MKRILFSIALVALLSCESPTGKNATAIDSTTSNTSGTDTSGLVMSAARDTFSINGAWFLQPVLASDTATGKIPTLIFNLEKSNFSGNTGCNNMNGSFQKTDTSLVFNEKIITTRMACPGYNEGAFLQSLLRTNKYKIDNGVLILLFEATELSRWTRTPEKEIKVKRT